MKKRLTLVSMLVLVTMLVTSIATVALAGGCKYYDAHGYHDMYMGECRECKTPCDHVYLQGKNACHWCGLPKDSTSKDTATVTCTTHQWKDGECSVCHTKCPHKGEVKYSVVGEFYHKSICNDCDAIISEKENHNFVKITDEEEVCIRCNYSKPASPSSLSEKPDPEETEETECEHEYEKKTVKATCTRGGYTKYTCTKCGDSYRKNKTSKLYHWFGEWMPHGNGGHTATCKRDGCGHSTSIGCETFEYALNGASYTLCPVCGENANGTHLELAEDATATSEKLPKGELVLRENDEIMSIGFEYGGKLTQPTKPVTVTLPAEVVNGYTLSILSADGSETAVETTADGENVSFTLDFGEAKVVLIHMTAAA